jgi:ABC-type lipoprotein export system ATPase subunit
MSEHPIILMERVARVYKSGSVETPALREVSIRLAAGEMAAIIGPSGSGKSTLMNLMGCLDVPTRGLYEFDGREVGKLSSEEMAELRNRSIGFVFQSFHLLPHATARENVEMPLLFGGMAAKPRRERAMEMLERVGLGSRASHLPTQLSGGEMQRVAVARALANRPRVILADEPTGNLDSRSGRGIIELFRELWNEGVTVVLITHDLGLARVCPRILKIQDGRIVHDGSDVPVDDETVDETIHGEPAAVASVTDSDTRLSRWAKVVRMVRGGRGVRGTRGLEPAQG